MNKTTFNAHIKALSNPKTKALDPAKVAELDDATRVEIIQFIVRQREPVAACLLPIGDAETREWLHCMGYLYIFSGNGRNLFCDCAQFFKLGGQIV